MIRVIGIGSPFGDDRVGWRVIELLGPGLEDIELIALDRPGAALVNWMQGVDRLILVDALNPRGSPGKVVCLDPDALVPVAGVPTSHALNLTETIALARTLGLCPTRVEIYGIEIAELDAPDLCPAVAQGARKLADTLRERLAMEDGATAEVTEGRCRPWPRRSV